jgi:hypothetical protein
MYGSWTAVQSNLHRHQKPVAVDMLYGLLHVLLL